MNKLIQISVLLLLILGVAIGQPRVKIMTSPVSTPMVSLPPFNADSCFYVGIRNVPNHTFAYMYAWNWGDNTAITSANWTFDSKPSGSNATITGFSYNGQYWAKFLADTTGTFQVHVSMVAGTTTKDTTLKIVSGNFVGTGGFYNVAPVYPNCMTCHLGMSNTLEIFNRWKVSGHANRFRYQIDSSTSYSPSCMKCHTTGYDHNQVVNNHGFDDVARSLGWNWTQHSPPHAGNWDTLRTLYPSLVAFSSIGCENCHGAGSEHAQSGDTTKITKDYSGAVCISCHDAPTHHIKPFQWKQSKHAASVSIYTSSFAQTSSSIDFGTNDLQNCIRCHDSKGYINFTKGIGTNTTTYTKAEMNSINCATCHDAHGNSNTAYLRNRPTNSDTLANGYHYSVGSGVVCIDCHKSRKNNVTYCATGTVSSTWGPHHSPQGDILLGQNASTFGGQPYLVGSHRNISDACVTCHMAPTADTGTPYVNKVGEHTFMMTDSSGTYDNVKGCSGCHVGVTHFSDFMAPYDIDGNNTVSDWQTEISGALHNLRLLLPPYNVDSVAYQLIAADSSNPNPTHYLNLKQAYWNYQMMLNDGSRGIHNPFYVLDVYNRTRAILLGLIGIKPVNNDIPNRYELGQNFPNPFNPSTTIRFNIAKAGDVTIKIYDILGKEVKTLVNQKMTPGKYDVTWSSTNNNGQTVASGVYFYRINAGDFTDVKKMVLVK